LASWRDTRAVDVERRISFAAERPALLLSQSAKATNHMVAVAIERMPINRFVARFMGNAL
jgi:hypothetical protein